MSNKVTLNNVEFVQNPPNSAWDAVQVTEHPKRGNGTFEVDGFRVFASGIRNARAIVRWMKDMEFTPRSL